jgi:hypothetical protein
MQNQTNEFEVLATKTLDNGVVVTAKWDNGGNGVVTIGDKAYCHPEGRTAIMEGFDEALLFAMQQDFFAKEAQGAGTQGFVQTKTFTVYWFNGTRTTQAAQGDEIIQDVFKRIGGDTNTIDAVDFYTSGDDHNYTWDGKTWVLKNQETSGV